MVTAIKLSAKDVLLAPIYIYQGLKVKRDTVRLPEPDGERHGQAQLAKPAHNATNPISSNNVTSINSPDRKPLNLMIVGDSAAAGVGSETQTDALAGRLIPALQQTTINQQFDVINWSLQATTGHTSFDILRRLYVIAAPEQPVEVMVLSVGVNDTTTNISKEKWQKQLEEIIAIAKRKFGARVLIFSSLPPMAQMPALPVPLNGFIGSIATSLDKILQQVCAEHDGVYYMEADFKRMSEEHSNGQPVDAATMFASDGFHPSPITYKYWAQQLAELINELLSSK